MKHIPAHTVLIVVFLFAATTTDAKTIKLDYEPKGQIVRIQFDSLTIYTDTTSLFNLYRKDGSFNEYDQRVRNLVLRQFAVNGSDTAAFSGEFFPFNDSINNETIKSWYVPWAVINLTRENMAVILDKHGIRVTKVVTKKVGTKRKGAVSRAYINKSTREVLFYEFIFREILQPRW